MTITFDHVGTCPHKTTVMVEGYSPRDGRAHGSLDVTVRVCDACHQTTRTQLFACGMTPYSRPTRTEMGCGDRTTFEENKYSTVY